MSTWRHTLQLCNALLLIAIALIVSAGWILRVPVWQYFGSSAPMVLNTALCVGLGGAALLAVRRGSLTSLRVARGLGGIITLLALLVLIENVIGTDLGVDWGGLHIWLASYAFPPGRMSPTTSFAFIAAGGALMLTFNSPVLLRVRYALAAIVVSLPILHLIGRFFLSGSSTVFGGSAMPWLQVPLLSALTAICLVLFGAGLLFIEDKMGAAYPAAESDRRIYVFLGAAFAVLLTVATVSYGAVKELQARLNWIDHSFQVRVGIERLTEREGATHLIWSRYLASGNPEDFDRFQESVLGLQGAFEQLLQLTATNSDQHGRLAQWRPMLIDDVQAMLASAERRRRGEFPYDTDEANTESRMVAAEQFLAAMRQVGDEEISSLRTRQQASQVSMANASRIMIVGNGIAFAILAAAFWALLYSQQQRSRLEQRLRTANENLEARIVQRTQDLIVANTELESLNTTLEQRVVERTSDLEDFSYSVSHDLRAPLRAIDGYSLILEEDHTAQLDTEGKRLIHQVRSHVQRMGTLIDDLLRLSRLGRQSLSLVHLDMNVILADVADEVLRDDQFAPGKHKPQLQQRSLPSAHGDASLLRQVWINLLSNAVKYSSRVAHPVIICDGKVEGSEIIYSISDNGSGFDMAHAGKLFGVFQRLHRYEDFPGTGVGLAIVQRIVRRHGGRVWAESAIDRGATFYFSLPRPRDADGDTYEEHRAR